jgi:hypothetical protein
MLAMESDMRTYLQNEDQPLYKQLPSSSYVNYQESAQNLVETLLSAVGLQSEI